MDLDPLFAATIGTSSYQVYLTARGETKDIFVAARDARGFEIREQTGGTASVDVNYRVVGTRNGFRPEQRLVRIQRPSPPPTPVKNLPKPAALRRPSSPPAR